MGKETEFARVIKPPGEKVSSGRVFRPVKALRNKGWLIMLLVAFLLWFFTVGGWVGIGWLIAYSEATLPSFWAGLAVWWMPVNIGVAVFNLVWLIPGVILLPLYVRSIEYSVISETGKTMPEIYVKKGIISVARKHVPFRTITNIGTIAGPLDRLFGIGTVEVETAGYSGQRMGPEVKLTGISFYEEVRDFILQELRKFRGAYALTTEVVRREEEPVPKPSKPVAQEKPAPSLPRKSVEVRPAAEEVRHLRPEPTPAPAVKDKGKELARMVAEMKPLLSLAREKDVEIGESKQLIDEAAVAGRERQLDKAIDFVLKSKNLLMHEIDAQLAKEIAHLNEEIRVAREFGGDISRASTYVQEVARARASGDVEAAYVYVDKVKKELLPITGRYNESKKKLANFKRLISDAEAFLVDTKEARGLLVDAAKAMDTKDFDRLETLVKTAQERLYMSIPTRMNDEMRKAKDDLLDAKMRNVNITPMITILKSATNLMKAGDYAQALREMREFKEMMKKPK